MRHLLRKLIIEPLQYFSTYDSLINCPMIDNYLDIILDWRTFLRHDFVESIDRKGMIYMVFG